MKFTVLDRTKAKKFSYRTHGYKYVIISINDVDEMPNRFNHTDELVGVLYLCFDDILNEGPFSIKDSDADKIVKFMDIHRGVEECVVHCHAGVSRSAGVAAALSLIFNGSDREIFENPRFSPNMLCYNSVLNAYNRYDNSITKED